MDIGIPPYMLASSVTMVLSQRLGRSSVQNCKKVVKHTSRKNCCRSASGKRRWKTVVTYGPVGCPECNGLGYKGRVGFFELMEMTDEVGKAISAEVPEDQLRKVAVRKGMTPLREAALQKGSAGDHQPRGGPAPDGRPRGKPAGLPGQSGHRGI